MAKVIRKLVINGEEYNIPSWGVTMTTIQVTLLSSGWSNNTQTVTATGVTANNNVVISPAPSSFSDYTDAIIYCSSQWTNSLTFTCDTAPSNDITVNVMVFN